MRRLSLSLMKEGQCATLRDCDSGTSPKAAIGQVELPICRLLSSWSDLITQQFTYSCYGKRRRPVDCPPDQFTFSGSSLGRPMHDSPVLVRRALSCPDAKRA